jgi:hypothetical protein
MSRARRMGRAGGLAASALAAVPFAYLWVVSMGNADDPLTVRARLDMAIWMAVFGTPWMVAARLLWRAWWRRAGARLAEVRDRGARWRFAAGCARAAAFPPRGGRAVVIAGTLALAALAVAGLGPAPSCRRGGCSRRPSSG